MNNLYEENEQKKQDFIEELYNFSKPGGKVIKDTGTY
jgi:hypothetical protein